MPDERSPDFDRALTLALLTCACVEAASARIYRPSLVGLPWVTAIAVVLAACAAMWTRPPAWIAMPRASVVTRWLGLVVLASGGYAVAVRAMAIRGDLEHGPIVPLGVAAVFGLGLVAYAVFAREVLLVVAGAVATGLALRAVELLVHPVDPRYADMIPLVVLALRSTFGGEAPYRVFHMPWDVPLTYLPLNWLAYAPATLLGIDLRWTNAIAELGILGAIVFAARRRGPARDAAIILWSAWFVSHSLVTYDGAVAGSVQWAAMAWAAACAVRRSRRADVVLGLALATTPLAVPLVPALAAAWRRRRARALLVAAAVAAALVLPFLLWSPSGFIEGVVLWFNDLDRLPRAKWVEARAWCLFPGFACAAWSAGAERLLKPLQLVLVLGLAGRYARSPRRRGTLGPELVAAFVAFMLVNPIVWNYLWEPAGVLALVALAASRRASER